MTNCAEVQRNAITNCKNVENLSEDIYRIDVVNEITEGNLAERFSKYFKGDYLYNLDDRSWYSWNKKVWSKNNIVAIKQRYRGFLKILTSQSKENKRQNITKELLRYDGRNKQNNVIEMLLSCEGEHICKGDKFDGKPNLLNFKNGTWDLEKYKFRVHRKKDYLTKMIMRKYKKNTRPETFEKYMEDTFGRYSSKLRDFMYEFMGLCLTNDVTEQTGFLFYGGGATGKTTFVQILQMLLGEYAVDFASEVLALKGNKSMGDIEKQKLRLKGAKLAVVSEAGKHTKYNSEMFKLMTGGDVVQGRKNYTDNVDFKPTNKLVIVSNHRIRLDNYEDAEERRMVVIPFDNKVDEAKRDRRIMEKMESEYSGILDLAIEGLKRYREKGKLIYPEEVKQASKEYSEEFDIIEKFLKVHREELPEEKIKASELYNMYKQWCNDNNYETESNQEFYRLLGTKGYPKKIGSGGNNYIFLSKNDNLKNSKNIPSMHRINLMYTSEEFQEHESSNMGNAQ